MKLIQIDAKVPESALQSSTDIRFGHD
jgi:hypothetical protein